MSCVAPVEQIDVTRGKVYLFVAQHCDWQRGYSAKHYKAKFFRDVIRNYCISQ